MRASHLLVALLLLGAPLDAAARSLRRAPARQRLPSNSLRRRLHVNSLLTKPGTLELESDYQLSSTGDWFAPAILKFTPEPAGGRTEFSVASDLGHLSNSTTLQALTSLHAGSSWNLAAGPLVSFLSHQDSGLRLGAIALARRDSGPHSFGFTALWSGANRPSDSNPAGTFDWGAGFGRRLSSHFAASANFNQEKSTGVHRLDAVVEGLEYQINPSTSFNLSGQHRWFGFGVRDHQLQLAFTINFGRLRHR